MNKLSFTVIGGDLRQARLAGMLLDDGHAVSCFGLEKEQLPLGITRCPDLKSAVTVAKNILLPLPVLLADNSLNAPYSNTEIDIEAIVSLVVPGQRILAGKIPNQLYKKCLAKGVDITDYFQREELAVLNSIPSAEGAIQIAMEEMPITLNNARCLVVGFGRIGKLLAHFLRGLGANLTVSARSFIDLAWVHAYGYQSINTTALDGRLDGFDVIFNTVPAQILGADLLAQLKPDCLCIDLASKPGGIDFHAASELCIRTIWALSIPGKVAPLTSALYIKSTLYNILSEGGEYIG